MRPSENSVSPLATVSVSPLPLAATDGPDLNGLALAAVEDAGAPGFGAIGVSDDSEKVVL